MLLTSEETGPHTMRTLWQYYPKATMLMKKREVLYSHSLQKSPPPCGTVHRKSWMSSVDVFLLLPTASFVFYLRWVLNRAENLSCTENSNLKTKQNKTNKQSKTVLVASYLVVDLLGSDICPWKLNISHKTRTMCGQGRDGQTDIQRDTDRQIDKHKIVTDKDRMNWPLWGM